MPLPALTRIGSVFEAISAQGSSSSSMQLAGDLRLVSHDDPEFENHVSSAYPKIANHELYPKVKKFMAVLSHEGTRQAKAYRVLWTIQQSANRQRTMQSVFIKKHCMLRNAVKVVGPGKKRLVSMFFNYSTADYNFDAGNATLRIPPNFPFLDSEVVSVSIDAVIYSDHTIAGPDKYDLRSHYLLTRDAEHDEGYSLSWKLEKMKAALGPGESIDPSKIVSILDYDIQYGATAHGNDAKSIYRFARSQEAALMKGLLVSRGLAALEANVARRVAYSWEKLASIG